MAARLVVRSRRIRRAKPGLVVEVRRHRLGRGAAAGLVEADAHLNALHLADHALAHGAADGLELAPGTLLRADLQDGAELLRQVRQDAALLNRLRKWLLQPDGLAGAYRSRRDERVPEVRQADHHGVDVGACAQFLVVVVHPDDGSVAIGLLNLGLRVRRALRVEVADGDDAGDVGALEHPRYLEGVRDPTAADSGNVYLAVGAEAARAAVEEDRGCPGGDYAAQEVTTVDVLHMV